MQPRYHFQKFVRDDVLFRIGLYVQTCAHIEHTAWLYLYLVDPAHPNDKPKTKKIMDLRLNTPRLVEALEKHLKKADPEDSKLLDLLIREIKLGLPFRNKLIHGALRFDYETAEYFLFSHWKADPTEPHEYESYKCPVSVEWLDEALTAADSILVQTRELHHMAQRRLRQ